jgi:hypothetical protein
MHEEIEEAFDRFVEQKRRDALNVAAAKPVSWEATGAKPEKSAAEKQAENPKKDWNAGGTAGVATVKAVSGGERRRRCKFCWVATKFIEHLPVSY